MEGGAEDEAAQEEESGVEEEHMVEVDRAAESSTGGTGAPPDSDIEAAEAAEAVAEAADGAADAADGAVDGAVDGAGGETAEAGGEVGSVASVASVEGVDATDDAVVVATGTASGEGELHALKGKRKGANIKKTLSGELDFASRMEIVPAEIQKSLFDYTSSESSDDGNVLGFCCIFVSRVILVCVMKQLCSMVKQHSTHSPPLFPNPNPFLVCCSVAGLRSHGKLWFSIYWTAFAWAQRGGW